jgi:hypothetical protein
MTHDDLMQFEREFRTIIESVNSERIIHHFINEMYKLRFGYVTKDLYDVYLFNRIKEHPHARLSVCGNSSNTELFTDGGRITFSYAHKFCRELFNLIGGTLDDAHIFLDELRINLI